MNALQIRLATILRNIDAPVTAEEIRERAQLPKETILIASQLRSLCRMGEAIELSLDRFAHPGYRPKPGESKPQPRKVSKPPQRINRPVGVSKTEWVLSVIKERATSRSTAMTVREISDALKGEISPDYVSSLLCACRKNTAPPQLLSIKSPGRKKLWAWCDDDEQPEAEDESMPNEIKIDCAKLAAALDDDDVPVLGSEQPMMAKVAAFEDGRPAHGVNMNEADRDAIVLSALQEMTSQRGARNVLDQALKVTVLEQLMTIAPAPVATVLKRIVTEDINPAHA